jgi:hypothetical protein
MLVLALLLVLATPAPAAQTNGKIKSVDGDKNEFVMTDDLGKDWTFTLDKEGKVFINDKRAKIADLKAGDKADVTYQKKDDKLLASLVKATRN